MGRRLTGITFAKQFPSSAEPVRGLFVLRQVLATADVVEWHVIAPVPSAPRGLERALRRPAVPAVEAVEGVEVAHPAYRVLPRQLDYAKVGASMARASESAFSAAVASGAEFVHAHALYPTGDAARRLAAAHALPLVVTVHGSDLYTMLARPAWADLVRGVVAEARAVVCVSQRLADDLVSKLGVGAEKVLVIPDAYDDAMFRPLERMPREASEPIKLACVGRLEPPKGQDVLVAAFARVVRAGADLTLTLVGAGTLERSLRERVSQLGVSERVTFTGALPPAKIVEVLGEADLYVQPSRREGFGVALVEAMATGLPVVATLAGGPDEIVGPDDGVLVAPDDADAFAEGISDAVARLGQFDSAAIAERTRARYSSAVVGERLVGLYYDVLGGVEPAAGTRIEG